MAHSPFHRTTNPSPPAQSRDLTRASAMTNWVATPPRYRIILAIDIAGSTRRTNPAKAALRAVMYELLDTALEAGGITDRHRDPHADRGDGILTLIRPTDDIPKTALLTHVIAALSDLLAAYNIRHPHQRFQMRAVVHAGEVHYDSRGCFGEALDLAFRLLDAPEVKRSLAQTTEPVILVISDDIYRSTVRHGYTGIDHRGFQPLVNVLIADTTHFGWTHIPLRQHRPAVRQGRHRRTRRIAS
jgi:class 3 adenylate cyclase